MGRSNAANEHIRRGAGVHDRLNDSTIQWKPEWASNFREYAAPFDRPGVVSWDGLILQGWSAAL